VETHWKPQGITDDRSVEHTPSRNTGNELKQFKREAIWAAKGKATGGEGATGFNVCHAGF
jgi:hypothetical protein